MISRGEGIAVPGAFMSMLGIALLNEVVLRKKIKTTGETLNELRMLLINNMKKGGIGSARSDGMDLALFALNHKTSELQFSGANRPLIIIRDKKVIRIKGDKMPIGKFPESNLKSFTNHKIKLENNDRFYMFSDGYADQFGGAQNKKFFRKRFYHFLAENSEKSFSKQKQLLAETFRSWKGLNEQTDDVIVFGLKYHSRHY